MMSPVTRQPELNPLLQLPNPPTPPKTEDVICDVGADCCFGVTSDTMIGCALGSGAGACLEYAASAGTFASTHFPLGLCCAFGFACCWQNLTVQAIMKKRQLDYAYHLNLKEYNMRLHERIISLSRQFDEFNGNQCQCVVSQPLNNRMPKVVNVPCAGKSEQHSPCETPPVKSNLFNNSLGFAFVHNQLPSLRVPKEASRTSDV